MTRAPIDTDKVREDWNFGHGIELPPAMARGWVETQMSIIAMCECANGSRITVSSPCRSAFAVLADLARLLHNHQRAMDDRQEPA